MDTDEYCIVDDGEYEDDNVETDDYLDHGHDGVNDNNDDVKTNDYKGHDDYGVVVDDYVDDNDDTVDG